MRQYKPAEINGLTSCYRGPPKKVSSGYMNKQTSKLFEQLLNAVGVDKVELEQQIWQEFGCTRAVLVMDSTGFTRITNSHGIVHYLRVLARIREELVPVFESHGSLRTRVEADNIYAEFENVVSAHLAAIEANHLVDRQRFDLADSERFGICIGIGFGQLLDSGHEGLYGPEMNLASKLGEDTAEAGEILLTEAAWTDLPADTQKLFRRRSVAISGADIAYHAMRAP